MSRIIACLIFVSLLTLGPLHGQRPNVVLILADDLGAVDLGCYGADLIETPNIDELADSGVRFTQAYSASPVCSPTRASILTGKTPARLHITIWSEGSLKGPENNRLRQAASKHDLPLSETTLAKQLQDEGYLTAMVGKWHLGDANHNAESHGFDINIGGSHWGAPQTFFWPYRGTGRFGSEYRYVPGLHFGKKGEYLTDRLTKEALHVIDHAADTQQPFFLYLAHHAPHTPIEAKSADTTYFQSKLRDGLHHRNPTYAAMIKSLDESVGQIKHKLRERGLEKNTIVIFTSDNGGYIGTSTHEGVSIPITSNAPLRSGKGTLYEGGIRVPLIVRWPMAKQPPKEIHTPVVSTDLYHTITQATRVKPKQDLIDDGCDWSGLVDGRASTIERETLYFHYPHYYHAPVSTPASAIRDGDWKLIQFYEDQHVELFNLQADPSEQHDLAANKPEKSRALRQKLQTWLTAVDANLPTSK